MRLQPAFHAVAGARAARACALQRGPRHAPVRGIRRLHARVSGRLLGGGGRRDELQAARARVPPPPPRGRVVTLLGRARAHPSLRRPPVRSL